MTTVANSGAQTRANPRLLAAVFFLAPLIVSIVPRFTPGALVLVSLALIIAAVWRGLTTQELFAPTTAFFACSLLSLYVFINASWAWDPGAGLTKAALLLGALLLVFATNFATEKLDERQLGLAALAFITGASLGALYLLMELLTEGAISRLAMNAVPLLQPGDTKRITIENGVVESMNLSRLNLNVTAVTLHLWPGLLMLRAAARQQRRWLFAALFFVALAAPVLLSEHDSSQLALLGSAFVFVLAWKWGRLTIRALAVLWCLGFALILPLSFAAYHANLHVSEALPNSYKARLIIWEYTAERTLDHPWFGVGVNSTREKDNAGSNRLREQPEGYVFKRTTGHHAHSIFLRTWYELGALGAILFALAGAVVVLRSASLPGEAQPFAAATFAAFATVAAFAWGMWQTWWICAAALAAIYLCVAAGSVRVSSGYPNSVRHLDEL